MAGFTIGGKTFKLTKKQVERALSGVKAEFVRKYYIQVNNRRYPIKQVIFVSLGLSKMDFTTAHAYHILQALNFRVKTAS